LDIQYNRNEDFKTIILPSASKPETMDTTANKETPEAESGADIAQATLALDDQKEIETTVIFLPNIWSLMPNGAEYAKVMEEYRNFIENPPQNEEETPVIVEASAAVKEAPAADKKEEVASGGQVARAEQVKSEKPSVEKASEAMGEQQENVCDPANEVNSIESLAKSIKAHYIF
jgi:hypothetical protein